MYMNKAIIIIMTLMSFSLFASDIEVKKIRGEATVLLAHKHEAEKVYVGQRIPVDSSILTKDKSFIVLEYKDKTIVSIGPNSKMVLNAIKDDSKLSPGVITLLKGAIRAKVTKDYQKDETFIIKSKTVSVGVRGTEFQVNLSSLDQQTISVLTYEGRVEVKRNDIEEPQSEIVSAGEASQVSPDKLEPLKPILIDSNQFLSLKNNKNLEYMPSSSEIMVSKDKPVIDMNSGIILTNKNVKLDKNSGQIIDEKFEIEKTNKANTIDGKKIISLEGDYVVLEENIPKRIRNEINLKYNKSYYDYKSNGVKYQFQSNDLMFAYTRKVHSEKYVKFELSKNLNTKLSGIKNGPSQKNGAEFKEKLLPSLSYIEKLEMFDGKLALEAGINSYNYIFEEDNYIKNKVKYYPKIHFSYENDIKQYMTYNVGLSTFYSPKDSLGIGASVALKKDINKDFNLQTRWSHEVLNDNNQKNTMINLGVGYDF